MDGNSIERLGHLHLVLLHLPIGFVVAAVLLELHRWRRPSPEGDYLQGRLLAVNACAALLTAGAGLVLASMETYPEAALELHRWAGLICSGLAVAVWAVKARGPKWLARGALAVLLGATLVAGHLGATLTHGVEVTTFWGGAKRIQVTALVQTAGESVAAGVPESVFVKEIQPVLERSCFECHGPDKAKGRLRLDSRAAALAGGRSGRPAIAPGAPGESELLRRVRLPRDDDEAMPSNDEPGLSVAEIAALEKWIAAGAVWR